MKFIVSNVVVSDAIYNLIRFVYFDHIVIKHDIRTKVMDKKSYVRVFGFYRLYLEIYLWDENKMSELQRKTMLMTFVRKARYI